MNLHTRFLGVAVSLAVTSAPALATASLLFPEEIRKKLELEEVPPPAPGCRICHKDDEGGKDNVTKPFGRIMRMHGAIAASVPAMLGALEEVEQAGSDSDHDGLPDVQELREGSDPNVAPPPVDGGPIAPMEDIPLPQTGCGVTRSNSGWGCASALALASLVLLRRREKLRR